MRMNEVMRKEAEAQFEESDACMCEATFDGTECLVKYRPDRVIVNLFRENAALRADLEEERRLHKWTASLLEAERANAKRLNGVIEWAIDTSLQVSRDINSGMVEQFSAELRQRVGVTTPTSS